MRVDETVQPSRHGECLDHDIDRLVAGTGDDERLEQVSAGVQNRSLVVEAPGQLANLSAVVPVGLCDACPDFRHGRRARDVELDGLAGTAGIGADSNMTARSGSIVVLSTNGPVSAALATGGVVALRPIDSGAAASPNRTRAVHLVAVS